MEDIAAKAMQETEGILRAIGALIPGLVSATPLLALIYAIFKGSQEWDKWKRERRNAKEAEIAAQALVAALRLLDALVGVVSISMRGQSEAQTHAQHMRQVVDARWKALEQLDTDFAEAWRQAEVFLSDSANEILEKTWKQRIWIWAAQDTYVETLPQVDALLRPVSGDLRFEDCFGPKAKRKVEILRAEVKSTLRPIAQWRADAGEHPDNSG